MSFRKRNVVVSSPGSIPISQKASGKDVIPGVRPSPLDGRLTTSTGTRSLDALLGGHVGLVLGTSLLIEEGGTTDFAGALLRYYAAEGVVQGHHVHVLGVNEAWARDLPGVSTSSSSGTENKASGEKMKIAWRYERLGEFGRDRSSAPPQLGAAANEAIKAPVFCHDFDLSKRLTLPAPPLLNCLALPQSRNILVGEEDTAKSPFAPLMQYLISQLGASSPSTIHRVIIPTLLSPALYPHSASNPQYVLQFLHGLRSLLRRYSNQLTILMSLPISLFSRAAGLTRWIEILTDGVLELAPFPSHATIAAASSSSSGTGPQEEPPQGMLRVYRIPISSEKGGGGGEISGHGDDMAFTLSRRKGLVIKPYSLPPVDNDEDGAPEASHGKATKVDIEF